MFDKLCLDLNQDGIPFIREKTPEELENGYEPSEELKKKFNGGKNKSLPVIRNLMKAYFAKPFQIISKLISSLKTRKSNDSMEDDQIENGEVSENIRNTREKFIKGLRVYEQDLTEVTEKKVEIQNKEKEIE